MYTALNVTASISDLLDNIRKVYQEELIDKNLRSSGKSSASLRKEVKPTEGKLYGVSYIYQLKHGRRPGKFPPVDAILDWIREKGIQARDNKTTSKQLAFLIGRKIAEKGTDIFTGKKPGLEVDEKINALVKDFGKKILEGFKTQIRKQ